MSHFRRWGRNLPPQDLIIVRQIPRGDVKPGQGVGQMRGRQVAQEMVEGAQGVAHFPGVLQIINSLKGLGALNKTQGPPERSLPIDKIVPAVPGRQHPGHLPAAAGA